MAVVSIKSLEKICFGDIRPFSNGMLKENYYMSQLYCPTFFHLNPFILSEAFEREKSVHLMISTIRAIKIWGSLFL